MIKKSILFKIFKHIVLISLIFTFFLCNAFDTTAFLSTSDIKIIEPTLTVDTLFAVFITFFSFSNDKSSNIFGISPNEIIRKQSEWYQLLFTKSFATLLMVTNFLSITHYFGCKNLIVSLNETCPSVQFSITIMWATLFVILVIYFVYLLIEGIKYIAVINFAIQNKALVNFYIQNRITPVKQYLKSLKLYENCLNETLTVLIIFLGAVDQKGGEGPRDAVRIMFESFDKADQIAALSICRQNIKDGKINNQIDASNLLDEIDKKFEISRY
ncbi:hypothetical protein [Streptococcus oralis]|jgi:hypothetical protein|uniref:hypothetical protein n=1 Tax=Streptococcus oralis TaxID=1303 RepID=UPI001F413A09|nr:hypothetical protein [Streptococcus oralis]UJD02756.1 hypothetical protein GOM47_08500 [Streptococcus oralis]